jgi:hypothetical protein
MMEYTVYVYDRNGSELSRNKYPTVEHVVEYLLWFNDHFRELDIALYKIERSR